MVEIEGLGVHGEIAGGIARPDFLRFVAVQFDSVLVGVAEVKRFADAVVGGAVEGDFSGEKPVQGGGEGGAIGIKNGSVIEARRAGRRRRAAETFPSIDGDVVMISAGGEKRCARTEALHRLQAEHAAVEVQSAFDVGDFEVDVADADLRIDDEG